MSGSGAAFNSMIDNMIHGGKIAMLGIQGPGTHIDWNKVVFSGLFIKGIYGRENVRDMVQDAVNASIRGLDLSPIVTHSIQFHYTEFEKGFETSNDLKEILVKSFLTGYS